MDETLKKLLNSYKGMGEREAAYTIWVEIYGDEVENFKLFKKMVDTNINPQAVLLIHTLLDIPIEEILERFKRYPEPSQMADILISDYAIEKLKYKGAYTIGEGTTLAMLLFCWRVKDEDAMRESLYHLQHSHWVTLHSLSRETSQN